MRKPQKEFDCAWPGNHQRRDRHSCPAFIAAVAASSVFFPQELFAVHGFFERPNEKGKSEMMYKMQEVSKQGLLLER